LQGTHVVKFDYRYPSNYLMWDTWIKWGNDYAGLCKGNLQKDKVLFLFPGYSIFYHRSTVTHWLFLHRFLKEFSLFWFWTHFVGLFLFLFLLGSRKTLYGRFAKLESLGCVIMMLAREFHHYLLIVLHRSGSNFIYYAIKIFLQNKEYLMLTS
jgi:hypothetical protein